MIDRMLKFAAAVDQLGGVIVKGGCSATYIRKNNIMPDMRAYCVERVVAMSYGLMLMNVRATDMRGFAQATVQIICPRMIWIGDRPA